MMGHHEKLKGGDEQDALTGWRRFCIWRPGQRKRIKKAFNKRQRRHLKPSWLRDFPEPPDRWIPIAEIRGDYEQTITT